MSSVWLNGEILPASEAKVPALDRGVLWGYGLFETLRVYGGEAWALHEHYERMSAGAAELEIDIPDEETLRSAAADVLSASGLGDAGLRFTITRGSGPPDPHSDPDGTPNVIVTAWPLKDMSELYRDGVSLVTIPGGGRPLHGIKTTSYAASVAGRLVARRAGADDALFVGEGGRVLEATGSNLFAVIGGAVVTPPLEEAVLPGVTRKHVMEAAARTGFEVREEVLFLSDLFIADEVVLTSSVREVYPVRSIDGRTTRRRDLAAELRAAYLDAVRSASSG